jgi:hypothetical protein
MMNSSGRTLTMLIGGVVIVTLLAFLALSSVAATFAWMEGGGYGSGPVLCQAVTPGTPGTPGTSTSTPGMARSPGGNSSPCVPASQIGAQVVGWAHAMASALYVNPTCGGRISYPDCYYTWYKAPGVASPAGMPTFPQAVIEYGQQFCPGCAAWANGTYQCVSFVRGAYSQVYPMRLTANAFDLWAVYAGQPGWMEIPSASAPPGQRGIPLPGDVMIFKDASIGHAAIVMSVELPTSTTVGAITFSNSNSVSPYTTMPLLPDVTVDTAMWPGYSVWGYIRPSPAAASMQVQTQQRSSYRQP